MKQLQASELVVDVGLNITQALGCPTDTVGTRTHVRALDELEEAAALFGALSFGDEASAIPTQSDHADEETGYVETLSQTAEGIAEMEFVADTTNAILTGSDAFHRGQLVAQDTTQKRFIIEALVVRKMSLDEANLDFMTL